MSYRRLTILVVLIAASAISFVFSFALKAGASSSDQANQSQSVEQRSPAVEQAEHYDVSPPLFSIPPAPRQTGFRVHDHERLPRPQSRGGADPVVQRLVATATAPVTTTNFDGIGNGVAGFTVNSAPPDTNGDVGPNHYVQTVNSDFAIYNKSGTLLYGPVALNTLWSGFGGGCQSNNDGDPTVVYDPIADRWVISQFSVSTTPYLQCVAVSQTPDPTGAYYRYSFSYSAFNDYPKMGVWPDGYYITFNMFTGGTTFAGAKICAYDRAKMLLGQPATQQCFDTSTSYGGLLPADLDGARQPPAGSPNYILGLGTGTNDLAFWKFHVDWTTPANSTLTGPATLTVASYAAACNGGTCIPQAGTTQKLDSLADRLMLRLAYRNFGDHESLVTNHSVTAGSSVGVRWYELRLDASHNPSVFQQGTYAPDANYRWMGSIATDQSGNMAMGFSVSGASINPQIHYTGRLAGDAAGTMTQGEGSIIDGAGSQTGSSLSRWGDYSNMTVDPVDDCTFWYTTEYIPSNGAFNWKTRIASFKFPGCGGTVSNDFSISANPTTVSVTAGGSGTTTISTAVTSGSAQTVNLSVSGLPAGASAAFNPTSVTSGGSSTLTLNSSTAAAGTYSLTVTGTGTSATHTTSVTFVINAQVSNNFSISASPSSLSIAQGANGTSTISTAVTSGSAGTVNLTASVSPAGPTASLSPASVTAGGSATLTVSVGAAVAAGSYTVTATGTEGTATHSTSVAVTVTTTGGGGIVNGGFETGNFSGWTAAGTTAVVNSGAHGGTFVARVGGTSPTNGDSSISQTFTAPAGSGQLTFWYQVHCPDTLTYDWATATLKDNTSGTTTTVLPKVCTNAGTWVQASANLTTGHSYTLTLIGHDDNYAGDPTYALYDDVSMGAPPPPPDFTISANPTSLSIPQGGAGNSAISTAQVGSAGTVSLTASVSPAGPTASLSPASITAGGSATLTVSVGATVAAGSYTVTVTGTEGTATHSTSVAVTVTAGGGGIVNGGFETGNFSGWTAAGTTAVVNSGAHSGTYAARVGGTSPTSGDSSSSQTFTVPAGRTNVSFWYKNTCPDTITYDWATATLRDNTTGTTTTVLPKVCTNAGTWVQTSANVIAGHSYTLTLISHDDNYAGDPTYTLFDDVTIQ